MTTPPPRSLTERYLHAAARLLPDAQRDEFRRELAERIGDAVDARRAAGASERDAEYRTLSELGDPVRLAGSYLDRPPHLIGPAYYTTWRRLLFLLLPIVMAVTAFGVALGQVLDGASAWAVVGSTAGTTLTAGIHVCFWVTLVFAVIDRQTGGRPLDTWTPDALPNLPEPARQPWSGVGVVVAIGWLAVLAVVVAVQDRFTGYVDGEGGRVPVFQPDTWAWLKWLVVAVLVLHVAVLVARYALGRWTWWLAGVGAALAAAFVVPSAVVLLRGALLDETFLERVGWADGPELWAPGGTLAVVLTFLLVVGGIVTVVDGFRQAHRDTKAGAAV